MFTLSTRRAWFLGIATGSAFSFWCNCASAQVIPDSTLPNNSIVNINGNTFNITGGTQAGTNLFHSFKDFSIRNGETAFFNNTVDIANIISRVTGGSISDINGLIRTSGTANLFLINPSGIVFGPNASLNVGGSFLASTANAIQFGNQGFFSATNPNTPPLLTVNPDALLFNQIAAASIQNNSVAPAGRAPTGLATVGLRVPDGKSLLLVGGNISMDGGRLNAFGGRVELGGMAGTGTVGLNVDGNNLSLSFPQGVQRADVSLINSAQVNVRKDNGGSIAINARNLELLGRSSLRTGIEFGLGSSDSKAGNIEINATGAVNLKDGSLISNAMLGATGNGGDINITADSFTLTNAATVLTSTFGQGDAGSVTLQAQDRVAFINGSYIATSSLGWGNAGNVTISTAGTVIADALNSPAPNITGVFSNVERESVGNAGNIDIKAASVSLANGAEITSKNLGQVGNAGNVSISARDTVSFDGVSIDNYSTGVFSNLGSNTVGRGGDIQVTTGSLTVRNGAQLISSTYGQGNGGNIIINARDRVSFDRNNTGAFSRVEESSIGKGGEIRITTDSLSVTNGALLSTGTFGQGDAGNIIIDARDRISFGGTDSDGFSSGAFSIAGSSSLGNSGDIRVTTRELSLTNGAQLATSHLGRGNAGNVIISTADRISLDGANSAISSALGSSSAPIINVILDNQDRPIVTIEPRQNTISPNALGNSGDISIDTKSLSVTNGARLTTSIFGQGDAGNISINALNTVLFNGTDGNRSSSGAFSTVEEKAVGNGGAIEITTGELTVDNGGQLVASSFGQGNAGTIAIQATDKISVNGVSINDLLGGVFAESRTGRGGDIRLTGNLLLLRRRGLISARSGVEGQDGIDGNIDINTKFLVAVPKENSDIIATGFGRSPGSNIRVNTQGIFGTQFRQQLTSESDIVATGIVTLNTPDVDPSKGFVELPIVLADTLELIADASCAAVASTDSDTQKSKFTITGRGGLPPNPYEPLTTDVIWSDNRIPNIATQQRRSEGSAAKPVSKAKTEAVQIVPATGWVFDGKGHVTLISHASNANNLGATPASCQKR